MHPVVFFDGVCNLCQHSVQAIIRRDPAARFRFASLQSELAQRQLEAAGVKVAATPDSIVLVEDGRAYQRSSAALRIARRLRSPWKLLWIFIAVPRPLRDAVYDFVARHRYRWFGKQESCWLPTPELRERFLT